MPWLQTNDVICSSFPCGPFPVPSDGIQPSPILLKVPFVLDTLQCETLPHNMGRRNKSELLLLAINKLIEACGRHHREDWSYCGLPYFFSYPSFCPVNSRILTTLMLLLTRKTQPENSPRGLRPSHSDRINGEDSHTVLENTKKKAFNFSI